MAKGGSLLYAIIGIVIMSFVVGAVFQGEQEVSAKATFTVYCGDGLINQNENCDETNLGGQTCVSMGYTYGLLKCTPSCQFDISGCRPITRVTPVRKCGNGLVEGAEQCDDGNIMNGDGCSSMCRLETRPPVIK